MADERSGGCACGAVRFTAAVTGESMDACHCETCRRVAAGPLMCVTVDGLTFADESSVGIFDSSEWAERLFCTKCGTNLAFRLKDGRSTVVAAFTFDVPIDLPLQVEVFIDSKPHTYAFQGETTKKTGAEVVAEFTKSNG